MSADVTGQVALVTGGGRGIGRTLAAALTTAGWRVAVTGRTRESLDEAVAAGDAALALPGDTTDRNHVRAAVRQAEEELGPLELVVANAGRFAAAGPLWEGDPDEWWRDVEVDLRGPQLALWAGLGPMVARGRGRAVVLGSGIGSLGMPHASAYSTAKAAVDRLVECVAGELEGTGVSAFVISPGLVATDMTEFPEPFLERYPEMRGRALREGLPPARAAELLLALTTGRYDRLSGRFLHVTTDLDAALAATDQPEHGTLRMVPYP